MRLKWPRYTRNREKLRHGISRSPRLAHKAPVMQATWNHADDPPLLWPHALRSRALRVELRFYDTLK